MRTSSAQPSLPDGMSAAGWVAVFLSPTAYFLLMVIWNRLQAVAPPAGVVVALFCIIPIVALFACGRAVWRKKFGPSWVALTVLGMALQVSVLLAIIVSAITVAISLPQ